MYRERGKAGAKLQVTGRDIIEQNLALNWSALTCCWEYEGDADELEITERRSEILNAIQELGGAGVNDIAEAIGQDKGNTHRRLQDMVAAGVVTREKDGRRVNYRLP